MNNDTNTLPFSPQPNNQSLDEFAKTLKAHKLHPIGLYPCVKVKSQTPEHLIDFCADKDIHSLKATLFSYEEFYQQNPDKLLNAFLNYSTHGHEGVFEVLIDFKNRLNISIKDNNGECFQHPFRHNRAEIIFNLMQAELFTISHVRDFAKLLSFSSFQKEQKKTEDLIKKVEALCIGAEQKKLQDSIQCGPQHAASTTTGSKYKI